MAQSSLLVHSNEGPRRGFLLIAAAIVALLALYMLNGGSYLAALAIIGLAGAFVVYKAAAYMRMDRGWLIVPLTLIAISIKIFYLEGALRAAIHYGLMALFCVPCVLPAGRSGIFRRGGFQLYSIYFLWALVTVTYSLAPQYSIVRLADSVLIFCVLSAIAFDLERPEDITRIVERFLIGCGVFVVIMAFAAVALPRSMTWDVPESFTLNQEVERFRGILNNPNDVGVLMLVTVGPILAFWNRFEQRKKKWMALLAMLAVAECAIADSRTPFIALALGGTLYLLWRYRLRGILVMAAAVVVGVAALPLFGHNLSEYTSRGDVTTLTGRTEMWAYVIQEIKSRPLIGYGYSVSGGIFESKYFPIWYGPWDQGPQSSLHNGYLDHAIGVGVPATMLWLFIVLRPWWFALRQKEDPWNLKPLALLVVLPCLVHNMSEASLGDFYGVLGILFGLVWAIGERYRLLALEQEAAERQKATEQMAPAVAVFRSARA
jgi:O-antigen ligase